MYDKSIAKAINELQDNKKKLQKQIKLLKQINENTKPNEEMWHKLTQTPIRTSRLMHEFIKNIFPDAENIEDNLHVMNSYISFELYGFKCFLPLVNDYAIYVDMSWASSTDSWKTTTWEDYVAQNQTLQYIQASLSLAEKNIEDNWHSIMILKYPNTKVSWLSNLKWKIYDKQHIHEYINELKLEWQEQKEMFEKRNQLWAQEYEHYQELSTEFVEILVPTLKTFTNNIRNIDYPDEPIMLLSEI